MINVTITSDIKIYCEGLAQILSARRDVDVLGVGTNYATAMELLSSQQTDVLLLDMTMREACRLARSVAETSPQTQIAALGVIYNEQDVVQCAEVGINCYIPREASVNQLVEAIIEAQRGECYCPPRIAAILIKKLQRLSNYTLDHDPEASFPARLTATHQSSELQQRLTRREREIAELLGDGLSNKQIARELSIEVSTVKNHVHNLLVKLEVENRIQVVSLLQKSITPSFMVNPALI